jgi:hypothetical protein
VRIRPPARLAGFEAGPEASDLVIAREYEGDDHLSSAARRI